MCKDPHSFDIVTSSAKKQEREYIMRMRDIFQEADKDGNNELSWQEFEDYLKDTEVAAFFNTLGLDVSVAKALFVLLDVDNSNAVNIDEFLPLAAAHFNEQVGKVYEPEVFRPFLGVRLRYLDTAFNVIQDRHGSIDAYLADVLGVDEALQEKLRARLID